MTRTRIYLGSFAALMGVPLFIYCLFDHSSGSVPFVASSFLVAAAVALLYPARWVK